jgi:hypothetical protein
MKKTILIISLFSAINAMEQEESKQLKRLCLPVEIKEFIRELIRKETERIYTTSKREHKEILSKNHTVIQEDKDDKSLVFVNVFGIWGEKNRSFNFVFRNLEENQLDCVKYSSIHYGECQFDGPNKKKLMVLAAKADESDESYLYLINKRKSFNVYPSCWCHPGESKYTADYTFIPQPGKLRAVAVHNKTNKLAVVCATREGKKKNQLITLYDAEDIKNPYLLVTDKVVVESEDIFKKITFVTGRIVAALTFSGQLFFLFIDEKNILSYHPQKLKLNCPIVDIAVDASNPCQMIMLLEDGTLLYGDIKKKTYSVVARNVDLQEIWYNDDSVYCAGANEDGETLGVFNLLPFNYAKMPSLVKKIIAERAQNSVLISYHESCHALI